MSLGLESAPWSSRLPEKNHRSGRFALKADSGVNITVLDYSEHAISQGEDAQAIAYVEVQTDKGEILHGVGRHSNIVTASLKAVTSAVNRVVAKG